MDEIVDEIIELDFDELENLDFLVDKLLDYVFIIIMLNMNF